MTITSLSSGAPAPRTSPDPDRQRVARQYHRAGRRLYLASRPVVPAVLLVLLLSGWSARFGAALGATLGRAWLVVALYAIVFGLLLALASLPATMLGGFVLPTRFGLLRQSWREWLVDGAKGMAIGGALGLVAVEALYWLLRHTGGLWWLLAGLGAFALSVLVGAAAPVLIAPLFFRFTPLTDGEMAVRLRILAERGRVHIRGIFSFDLSRKWAGANAAVFGFGPTRRIVVADSVLADYPADGVEAVVAHELGHHVHGDLWILSIAGGLATLLGLFAVDRAFAAGLFGINLLALPQPGQLPAVALIFGLVDALCGPALLALSRLAERRADAHAARLGGQARWLRDSLVRLADENLVELDPPRWEVLLRFSHPPMRERLAYLAGGESHRTTL